jgi:manganese efflux pump family protein
MPWSSIATICTLAVGLAMDAVVAAWALSLCSSPLSRKWRIIGVALMFGGAQTVMPAIGFWVGVAVSSQVQTGTQGIAALVLMAMGAKMLWDSHDASPSLPDRFSWRQVMVAAVATSIDALAAGVTLPMLGAPLGWSIIIIGVITTVLCVIAGGVAMMMGQHHNRRLTQLGGVVLIGLAIHVVVGLREQIRCCVSVVVVAHRDHEISAGLDHAGLGIVAARRTPTTNLGV